MKLGKLKEVDIRDVWKHEQYGFSSWLAHEENIVELGDILGLNLVDVQTEQFVGKFRCDVICRDEFTSKVVLIENQLESTNHDHLGKILTYASGLDASVIVWIVESAREEHASAIEWLNKHTDDTVDFFLIEVHAYRIGDSLPAAQFKIIEQPNDFARTVKSISKSADVSETTAKRLSNHLEFWTMFNDVVDQKGKPFNKRKANTDHWYNVAIGSSQCHLEIVLQNKDNHRIRVGLYIHDNKELFDKLYSQKEQVEESIPYELTWERLNKKKASYICTFIPGLDLDNKSNYEDLMNQIIDRIIVFKKVFCRLI